jgi:hypothetical protein
MNLPDHAYSSSTAQTPKITEKLASLGGIVLPSVGDFGGHALDPLIAERRCSPFGCQDVATEN